MIHWNSKAIFIHCQKCAGESIEKALKGKADKGYKGDPFEGSPNKHATLKFYKQNHKWAYKKFFKFTVVRNPYDRFISWVKYRDKRRGLYKGEINHEILLKELEMKVYSKFTYKNLLNLKEKSKIYQEPKSKNEFGNDNSNELDFIGRFENLEEDFQYIKNKLSIDSTLPHINKSSNERIHYSEYYNDELIDKVSKLYAFDLDYFNYKFEKKS